MPFKAISASLMLMALAAVAPAQTKISGTVQCGKPDEQHVLEVGDQPHHSLMISKGKCTWTKPMEIAGTQTKEDVGSGFDEVTGNKSQGHGYVVGTLANGDEMHVRTQGSATIKNAVIEGGGGYVEFHGWDRKATGGQRQGNLQRQRCTRRFSDVRG